MVRPESKWRLRKLARRPPPRPATALRPQGCRTGRVGSVWDGRDIPDLEGTIFADIKAARAEAISTGGAILKDLYSYWDGTEWRMNVTDEEKTTLLILRFSAEVLRA